MAAMSHESQGTATANDAGIDAANESWKFFFYVLKTFFLCGVAIHQLAASANVCAKSYPVF